MSKRRIERRIEELEGDDGEMNVLILYGHDDGERVTDQNGDEVTEEQYENANIVIDYVSWDVAKTWPNIDDDDDTEAVQS